MQPHQTEYTSTQGVTYEPVDEKEGCKGCVFQDDQTQCSRHACSGLERSDDRGVIWVVKETAPMARTVNGVDYEAVPDLNGTCDGCHLSDEDGCKVIGAAMCSTGTRSDKRNILWIKKGGEDKPEEESALNPQLKVFKGVMLEAKLSAGCDGCFFDIEGGGCAFGNDHIEPDCRQTTRLDFKDVIWVRKETPEDELKAIVAKDTMTIQELKGKVAELERLNGNMKRSLANALGLNSDLRHKLRQEAEDNSRLNEKVNSTYRSLVDAQTKVNELEEQLAKLKQGPQGRLLSDLVRTPDVIMMTGEANLKATIQEWFGHQVIQFECGLWNRWVPDQIVEDVRAEMDFICYDNRGDQQETRLRLRIGRLAPL